MTNSYFSIVDYEYTGQSSFTAPSYLQTSDITVTVNGVAKVKDTDYTLTGTSVAFTGFTPSTGDKIRIQRSSGHDARRVDFNSGSMLKAETLDADSNQMFYMAQEAIDTAQNISGDYNAKYWGSLPNAPASPSVGDLWFDSTNNVMKVYNTQGWQTSTSAVTTSSQRVTYTVGTTSGSYDGSTSTFPVTYDSGFVDVYLNGVKQVLSSDFQAANGSTVVLTPAASSGDIVDIVAYGETYLSSDIANKLDKSGGTLTGDLAFGSNKAVFPSLEIYGAIGDHSVIEETGSGNLIIKGTDVRIQSAENEEVITGVANGAVTLYYNNTPKLATTNTGISITGTLSATGYNSSNWDTAYGWGDHLQAGYLTSYTETDPVFSAHAASGVTSTKISNWDTAYGWGNHASAGYLTAMPSGYNNSNWDTAYSNHITGVNYSGSTLTLTQQDGGTITTTINASGGGGGGGGETLAQTLAIGDTTGGNDISFGDNDKAKFGASDDLQIYHDAGGDSYIKESGSGNFYIEATNLRVKTANNETYIAANQDGAVNLYNNNAIKLATTSTGIDVTGTATMDGLTVDGEVNLGEEQANPVRINSSSAIGILEFNSTTGVVRADGTGQLLFETGGSTDRLKIANNGDISFYEDTGTTPKFFWDASAESLGIGTSSPNYSLTSYKVGANANYLQVVNGSSGPNAANGILYGLDGAGNGVINKQGAGDLITSVAGAERMRIDSSGNVGIGTTSPEKKLHIFDSTQSNQTIRFGNPNATPLADINYNSSGFEFLTIACKGTTTGYGNIKFQTGNTPTDAMLIDSSGRVGIGTSSPSAKLTSSGVTGTTLIQAVGVDSNGFADVEIKSTGTTGSSRLYFSDTAAQSGSIKYSHNDNSMQFATNGGSEKMRIDSSGNLLVGKTSANSLAEGFEARANGLTLMTKDGGSAANFKRKTSDGNIVVFEKDGSPVGSIGTTGGDMYVGTGDTGIRFDDATNHIRPCGVDGANLDATIDIGDSSRRFKDLYLSGGVHLGGTGSANKLDDYEEGTWTPTIYAATTGTNRATSIVSATYTKIGRLVRCKAYLSVVNGTALNGDSGAIQLGGLPFTASAYGHLRTLYSNLSSSSITGIVTGTAVGLRVGDSQAALQPSNINTGSNNIMIDVTFEV